MIFRHLLNMRSHPTWVRGLKLDIYQFFGDILQVAPYVGAWIETLRDDKPDIGYFGRTLRGCVD